MNFNKKISIIIPSFNSQNHIKLCLSALNNQSTDISYEIIVVDCTENNPIENLCENYKKVKLLHEKERFSPGIGRNIGAKSAVGELLVFLDSDIILDKNALKNIWQNYENALMVFSGALELTTELNQHFPTIIEHAFFLHEAQKSRQKKERKNLNSAILIIQKEIFDRFKGFKNIPRMQDAELTERLKKSGIKMFFIPEIFGQHNHKTSLVKALKKIFINGNNLYYIRDYKNLKFFKKAGVLILMPIMTFVKMSRISIRNLKYSDWNLITQLLLIPIMYFCGIIWMGGIYYASVFGKGISKNR